MSESRYLQDTDDYTEYLDAGSDKQLRDTYYKLLELINTGSKDYLRVNRMIKSVFLMLGTTESNRQFKKPNIVKSIQRATYLSSDKDIHNYLNKICMRVSRKSETIDKKDILLVTQLRKVIDNM